MVAQFKRPFLSGVRPRKLFRASRPCRPFDSGPRFDPSQLLGQLAFWRTDYQAVTFNALQFASNNTTKDFSATSSTWLNGLTQCSIGFYISLSSTGGTTGIIGRWQANTQNQFLLQNISGRLAFLVASGLTDPGNNGVTMTGSILADTTGQATHHVLLVFDGSLSGTTNRARIYVDGALVATTGNGTVPAALTTSTATLKVGSDGAGDFLNSAQLWDVMVWAGTALTSTHAAAFAAATPQSGNLPYLNGVLPAGVPTPDHWWRCNESSDGSGAVTRADNVGAVNLTDSANTPSFTFGQWGDWYGNGNLATSVGWQASATVDSISLTSNFQNGLPAWVFPTGGTHVCNFKCGKLGRTTNPPNWTVYLVISQDDATAEQWWCGAEQPGGDGLDNNSTNSWGCADTSDFPTLNHGSGGISAAYGDGAGKVGAAYSPNNGITSAAVTVVSFRYTAGDDHVQVGINGVQQSMTVVTGGVFPFVITTATGGTMNNWRIGQQGDFNSGPFSAGFKGKVLGCAVHDASHSDGQRKAMEKWLGRWAAVGVS